MSSSAVLGQYLWHELLTTDPDAGAGFYAKVLGWSRFPYEGDPGYAMLGNGQGPVGGVRLMGKDPLADKAGPNWLTYVGVPDLTAALAAVEAKGGRVIHPVTAVPGDGGRYAVIADPQGAAIGLYEPSGGVAADSSAPTGPAVWHELTAENPEAALQFYNAIFGWDVVATHDMGGEVGTYYLFGKGTTQMGGAFVRGKGTAPSRPRWLVYLGVAGLTAAVDAVKAAGGKVLNGPHQVPGGNWVAQVLDSHGVPLALHGPKEAAAAAPNSPAKPKAKAKAKTKAAPKAQAAAKPKAKTKVKAKAKAKVKTKAKGKKAPKPKVVARRKGKVAVKAKAKAKSKPKAKRAAKAKRKAKTKVRSKARKAPRRGK
jgi:predicted enzyme related to lactoylglutathione lyase